MEPSNFLKRLTVAVGNTPKSVLVFSLQSSKRESLDYINLLQTIDRLAARKDQRREPLEGNEVLRVIQRRLLGKMPSEADSTPAATGYQEVVTAILMYSFGGLRRDGGKETEILPASTRVN